MRLIVDVDKLEADLQLARERVSELESMIALAQQYGQRVEDSPEALPPMVVHAPLVGMGSKQAVAWLLENSRQPWKVELMVPELLRIGWETTSEDPLAVIRTAVQRLLVESPNVQRVGHGVYQWIEE